MRRLFHALTIVLVTIGLVGVAAPAQAASKPGVKISKFTVTKPAYGASTVIKPKYRKGPRTKIVSAKVTVRGTAQAGRNVNASGTSVRVTAGTYKVTTKVVFKVKKTKKTKKWSGKKTKTASYTHIIGQGAKNCATMSDYNAIRVGDDDTFGSFKPEVERLMAHVGKGDGSVLLEDMYWYFYDRGDYETAAFVANMQEVYGDDASTEIVTYKMCASTRSIEVFYVNYTRHDNVRVDEVIDKEIV
ncbi:hypothetical protein GL325_13625 [Aeromicrobium sp. 636]|uniref:Uncharacterized protein n=1 Tax=Aeromicrobium senzhongii TaxID=2663859 RepID=A0A8I0EXP8_9ACTN|nr:MULTISPECIES: hypothetical protein [Aeromicrobium]MBC9227366.1 hypothetical protein [Aeromicrobium senzhongii]MCQ3999464.1 hypothetical protein [Aeromicrobium sp. 636]